MSAARKGGLKLGQRAIVSCQFCYRRKIKCSGKESKVFPCDSCKSRGIADECHQAPVLVRGTVIGGTSDEAVPLSSLEPEILAAQIKDLQKQLIQQEEELKLLRERDTSRPAVTPPSAELPAVATTVNALLSPSPALPQADPYRPAPSGVGNLIENSDVLMLGLSSSELSLLEANESNPTRTMIESHGIALLDLVPIATSSLLVRAHFNYLSWVHCVVHEPSFLAEHDEWNARLKLGNKDKPRYDFLARYFAIISSALFFLDESMGAEMGFSPADMATLPRLWANASIEALQRSDFMCSPTLISLQAVCILPMITFALGLSVYMSSLLHCALGACQTLKIHLLSAESTDVPQAGLINRELGRRIWACLRVAECLGPAAHQPYALMYQPGITADPLNLSDEELIDDQVGRPHPLHELTHTSHLLAMTRRASLFRRFNHALYHTCTTLEQKWALATSTDKELLQLRHICPPLYDRAESFPTRIDSNEPFNYLPWAQHLWATSLGPCRIWVYRSFLSQAFSDERFREVRTICLESARLYMTERRKPTPPMYRRAWAIAAYTSLAGMVIATEYLHGSNSAPVNLRLRGEVLEIIDLLERERTLGNVMTTRGVNLLRVMIGDSPSESNVGGQVEEENAPAAASPIWAGLDLPALEELWPADGFGIDGGDAMWWNGNGNGNGTSGSGVGGSDWLATSFGGDGSGWPEF